MTHYFITNHQVVHLWNTSLTEEQLEHLFSTILVGSCLKRVNVGRNVLSSVPAGLLAGAVNMLEAAEMELTGLTCGQVRCGIVETFIWFF